MCLCAEYGDKWEMATLSACSDDVTKAQQDFISQQPQTFLYINITRTKTNVIFNNKVTCLNETFTGPGPYDQWTREAPLSLAPALCCCGQQ